MAFYGWGNLGELGIYLKTPAELRVVADNSTPMPVGSGTFSGFYGDLGLSDTEVAFVGWGLPGGLDATGVYLYSAGTLSRIADTSTPIPGTTETFKYFRAASVDQGQVAFAATSQNNSEGVYTATGSQIQLVAGPSTPMPGDSRNFTGASWPVVQNGSVVFVGNQGFPPYRSGIYSVSGGGPVMVLVDSDTPAPGGTGVLGNFGGGFSVDREGVGFSAWGAGFQGLYTYRSGSVSLVADPTTPVPGGNGTFTALGAISVDNGHAAFGATSVDRQGIYANLDGSLVKVIDSRDKLDGKEIARLDVGPRALSNDVIAFSVGFADGSSGIYLAFLSPPARVCSTTITTNPNGLDLRFDLRTPNPVVWNLWLSYASTTTRLWSFPLPVVGTTVSIPWSIPGLRDRGSLGFLSTFVTAQDGIVCSDWDVVDTGHP